MLSKTELETLAVNAITEVMIREGGDKYTNRAADRGGPTRWGVTQVTARAYGYTGDMQTLPKETAIAIFRKNFWDLCKCDQLAQYSKELAVWVFDFAVNSSPANAIAPLQGLLNVLNNRQKLYKDFEPAANIGPKTIAALDAYSKVRDIKILGRVYNSLRTAFLYNIAVKDESQEENVYGWFIRAVNITDHAGV